MSNYTVSVSDFGAIPCKDTLQTGSFQKAIDAVFLKGGGTVEIPAGKWSIGGIRLRSGVTLHLLEKAELIGSRNYAEYDVLENDLLEPPDIHCVTATGRWNHGLIRGINADHIAIIGEKGSLIDGGDCFDPQGEEGYRGPHGIHLFGCHHITLKGYTIRNTGNWAHCIYHSSHISAASLQVYGGHDGFHVRGCTNITVEDCIFHTGDDCIAGFANLNVTVRRCDLNTACSSFRLGGTNILIEDCHAWAPAIYGHRYTMTKEEQAAMLPTNASHRHTTLCFFTYFCDHSLVLPTVPGNIVVRNCVVDGPERFFQFNFSGNDPWQSGMGVRNILFDRISASNISIPIVCYADESLPVVFELTNSVYALRPGYENIDPLQAGNFERICLRNTIFHNSKAPALITCWGKCGVVDAEGIKLPEESMLLLRKAENPFSSARI